jgi:anti-sigma B factor antagonist
MGVGPQPTQASKPPSLAESLRPPGPIQFDVARQDLPGRTVVQVHGEVDAITAPGLAVALDEVLRMRDGAVTVDLSATTFLDSVGLYVLLNAARRLTRRSRRLDVICGAGAVRRVIELARLEETLNVADPQPAQAA